LANDQWSYICNADSNSSPKAYEVLVGNIAIHPPQMGLEELLLVAANSSVGHIFCVSIFNIV
jgi:hypothetical protein